VQLGLGGARLAVSIDVAARIFSENLAAILDAAIEGCGMIEVTLLRARRPIRRDGIAEPLVGRVVVTARWPSICA